MFKNLGSLDKSYLPYVNEYVEYDFRNLQALESLEDALWESNHPSIFQEEYLNSNSRSTEVVYFGKTDSIYNSLLRPGKISSLEY
jgi:hypothetical protein